MPYTARQNRVLDRMNDVGWTDRASVRFKDFMGIDTDVSLAENRIKAAENMISDVSSFKSTMTTLYSKYGSGISISDTSNSHMQSVAQSVKDMIDNNSLAFSEPVFADFLNNVHKGRATYQDLLTVRDYATEHAKDSLEMANLARTLRDDNEVMKGIQKKMFEASVNNHLTTTGGGLANNVNLVNADDDMKGVIDKMHQDYNRDAVPLGAAVRDARDNKTFDDRIKNIFKEIEQEAKNTRNAARQEVTGQGAVETAARESVNRHKQNSQKNGGS